MSIDQQVVEEFGDFLNGIPRYAGICRKKGIDRLAITSELSTEPSYIAHHDTTYQITQVEEIARGQESRYNPQLTIIFSDYSYLKSIIDDFQWIRDNKWVAIKKFKGNIKVRPRRHYLSVFRMLTS